MLACKVVLGESDGTDTLVFDEVDAGVGGATAVALAQVLARLAKSHQVIVVTHLAQVAVMADRHYLVSKEGGDLPETTIEPIEGEARVSEVARMLSGDQTQASLEHAREMLAGARGQ
jgi:DNA repair protein RecN (Recombination protein N)